LLAGGFLFAQGDPFPEAVDGELYYAPRIDLLQPQLTIELDGELDEEAWGRAWFEEMNGTLETAPDAPEDTGFRWAAVADAEYLYVAVEVTDDLKQAGADLHAICDVWQDDSFEVYIDANNDGPDCAAAGTNCYKADDAQYTVGRGNADTASGDPDLLQMGGLAGKGACDFTQPNPELCRGVIVENEAGDGWRAEIAIALTVDGNESDGTPTWSITPGHGCRIGWTFQLNDDDDGAGRDTKGIWTQSELAAESAWRDPGVFGKLVFIDPTRALPQDPVSNLACARNADGTVGLTWENPEGADPAAPILVLVDDAEAATVPGGSTGATLPEAKVPQDDKDHIIKVDNGTCTPTSCRILQNPFEDCGGIKKWNILGWYSNAAGGAPAEDIIRADYMTDGVTTELDFVWFPGAGIVTDFGITAASTTIGGGSQGRNWGGVPTVFEWETADGIVRLNDVVFGGDPNYAMAYAQCYVVNKTATDIEAYLGVSSDDSVGVIWNGEYYWIHSIGRGGSSPCNPTDVTTFEVDGVTPKAPLVIAPGENNLIVKVFEGEGGFEFSLRFQDELGQPIAEGLSVRLAPTGACAAPPFFAERSMNTGRAILLEGRTAPAYEEGATYDVAVNLSGVRAAGGACSAPASVKIVETAPQGWEASAVSGGGSLAGQTITWNLSPPFPASLTYKVKAAVPLQEARFSGLLSETGGPGAFSVSGAGPLYGLSDFSDQGFIKTWLLLGPYSTSTDAGWGAAPALDNMRLDFLTDGADITEANVRPKPGDTVQTEFGGAAASTGLASPATANGINPGDVPTWAEWHDRDDTIDFNNYYGGNVDAIMMHAVTYVSLNEDKVLDIGLASDDSVQVLLDGVEIHILSLGRGYGAANTVLDTISSATVAELNPLTGGIHEILVKVFEGDGSNGFRLRFQEPGSPEPVTEGITVCLDPDDCGTGPLRPKFLRADPNNDGAANITDGIYILNYLFLGGPGPTCMESADPNDDGTINITDGIYVLNYLFLGGPAPAAPGPAGKGLPCGVDREGSPKDLGCAVYTKC
jgi:hypothetical protein